MHTTILHAFVILVLLWGTSSATIAGAEQPPPIVGQIEQSYTLARKNREVRGLAVDETSPDAPRLVTLDRSGTVFIYALGADTTGQAPAAGANRLRLLDTVNLRELPAEVPLADPRGLAFAVEDGRQVLYFLDWARINGAVQSRLYRYTLDTRETVSVDLSLYLYRIGDREVLDLAYDRGKILLAFDASGYTAADVRVQRGIARYRFNTETKDLEFLQHMPDAGTKPSRGIAAMQFEGASYLWATVGNDHVYCADGPTGRGLFFFNRPCSDNAGSSCWGICFGVDSLWVSENTAGSSRVHRVNVTQNLDASHEGPRVLRHLVMSIRTEPEGTSENSGAVYHYYSRPYAYEQLHNQGVWPETESLVDLSNAPGATLKSFTDDPADDTAARQHMSLVEYADGPARAYSSKYEVDLWTNAYKKFVYPHRVDHNRDALEGTDYLADDRDLYDLSDTKTYTAFIERVKAHVTAKYTVDADMKNSYWAARNIVEYIQDNYYYPNRQKRMPAAVDYQRNHYDANPGNLKIELSDRPYDKTQIIACSGTSVMVTGAMRHLGFFARWLGTGTQQGPETWDANHNGLLDPGETAPSTNGHRYSQVWLGSHYGWICFDATPPKPAHNDYDPPPPLQSQWVYMTRAASGHRVDNRVVYNVGSALFSCLYRDFEYDPLLAVDNNCGGDQRYNLQGRFEKPEWWKLARSSIHLENLCFVTNVSLSGAKHKTLVTWQLDGAWDKCPEATLSICLEQVNESNVPRDIVRLARTVPHDAKSATVNLSDHRGKRFRIILRKDGDPETGGHSDCFDLE